MKRSEEKLGGRKEAVILALLTARSIEEAARIASVPLRTLHRWLKEPGFDAAFRLAKRATFGQAMARVQQGASAAATIMLKIMLDPHVPAATRLKASEYIFSQAKSVIEIEEIEARLTALEQAKPGQDR